MTLLDLGIKENGTFDDWVEEWIENGAEGTWETRVIATLGDHGLLSDEFLSQFNDALEVY